MDFDWKKLVASVAPMIGTALGGPLGGSAVAAIAAAFGIAGDDEQAVAAAVANATPEQLLALRSADHDFKAKMAELGFKNEQELARLSVEDRSSARSREISIKDKTPAVLAFVVTIGFFGILAFMLVQSPPEGARDVLNIMLGALATAWISIVAYYFGSSSGSAEKTRLMSKGGVQDVSLDGR